jgi:DnaJ-class molecular chaperone
MTKEKCPNCFGKGEVEALPPFIEAGECLTCKGTGEFDPEVDG